VAAGECPAETPADLQAEGKRAISLVESQRERVVAVVMVVRQATQAT